MNREYNNKQIIIRKIDRGRDPFLSLMRRVAWDWRGRGGLSFSSLIIGSPLSYMRKAMAITS